MEKLQQFVMAVIAVAVALAVGLLVLSEFNSGRVSSITPTTYTNETVTWQNATAVAFANTDCLALTCTNVYNNTANTVVIPTTQYTCSTSGLTVTKTVATAYNTDFYVTYQCTKADAAYTATATNVTNLAKVPTWIGILITVALAFLVLGYFYNR